MNGLAAVLAISLSACNEWGPHQSVTAPSNDPSLTAAIRPPLLQTAGNQNTLDQTILVCSQNGQFTGPLDVVMTAGHDVNVQEVDLSLLDQAQHLLDQNEFSHDELAQAFGTTVIPGGTITTFRFHTDLWCGRQPQFVEADIKFIETSGLKNSISVIRPFQPVVIVSNGF